jgi:hypothetical protein
MGQLDLTRHIKWSADDDWYYGSIETVGPDGVIGTLEAKISRPWVYETAMAIRKRLMQTAPAGVNVGAWTNVSDPARFQKLCQSVANERVKAQIVEKYKRHGVTPMPWFGPWTPATADAAYELVVAAQAGDDSALAQLDRIRAHAEAGHPRAMEALAKINAVAKMVVKGLPKPSVLAQHMVLKAPAPLPALTPPARPPRPTRRPPPALPALPALPPEDEDEDEDEEIEGDDAMGTPQETGDHHVEMNEFGPADVSPSEEDIEFGKDLGWVADKFVSVDGAQWSWTGEGGTDKIVGETRGLRSVRGGELKLSKMELLELIKEGELTPVSGTEVAGLNPAQRRQVVKLTTQSKSRSSALRQQRSTQRAQKKSSTVRKTARGTVSASTPASPTVPRKTIAAIRPTAAASIPTSPAAAAAAAAQPVRIPGLLYPGDVGYPLLPGMPGYGSPVAGQPYAGVPQGYPGSGDMGGGGGGGGTESFPDEDAQGGGGDMAGSFDAPDVLEDDLPTDGDGNVVFPEEGDQPMDGAQYPEEVSQSTETGAAADEGGGDGDGPDVFPGEGSQPAGRG